MGQYTKFKSTEFTFPGSETSNRSKAAESEKGICLTEECVKACKEMISKSEKKSNNLYAFVQIQPNRVCTILT